MLVLSDARWEEEPAAGSAPYDEPGAVGCLVAVPRPGAPPDGPEDFLAEHYDLNHGSAEVPERLMAGLVRRRQQIGQLEILATIVPYLSMPATLAGRDVVHWIDDEGGAGARLFKGAGQLADGARAACVQPGPAREAVVRVRALEGQPGRRAVARRPLEREVARAGMPRTSL